MGSVAGTDVARPSSAFPPDCSVTRCSTSTDTSMSALPPGGVTTAGYWEPSASTASGNRPARARPQASVWAIVVLNGGRSSES